jgi:hypothetical protein
VTPEQAILTALAIAATVALQIRGAAVFTEETRNSQ